MSGERVPGRGALRAGDGAYFGGSEVHERMIVTILVRKVGECDAVTGLGRGKCEHSSANETRVTCMFASKYLYRRMYHGEVLNSRLGYTVPSKQFHPSAV